MDFLGGGLAVFSSSSGLSSVEELLEEEEGEVEGFCAALTTVFCCVVFKMGLEVCAGAGVPVVNGCEVLFLDKVETGCDSIAVFDLTGILSCSCSDSSEEEDAEEISTASSGCFVVIFFEDFWAVLEDEEVLKGGTTLLVLIGRRTSGDDNLDSGLKCVFWAVLEDEEALTGGTILLLFVRRSTSGGDTLVSGLECESCLRLFLVTDLVVGRERRLIGLLECCSSSSQVLRADFLAEAFVVCLLLRREGGSSSRSSSSEISHTEPRETGLLRLVILSKM